MRLTSKCHPSVGLDSYCPEHVLSSIQVSHPSPAETGRNKNEDFCPRSHVDTSLSAVDGRVLRSPALMNVSDSFTFCSADRGDDEKYSWASRARRRSVTQRRDSHSICHWRDPVPNIALRSYLSNASPYWSNNTNSDIFHWNVLHTLFFLRPSQ